MEHPIALKRLTASDLTFFDWHFRQGQSGNQKAINLNADVFIDELYPQLPTQNEADEGKFNVTLQLFGPGVRKQHTIPTKIVKGASYKNWRLGGSTVENPSHDPQRYNSLSPDDIAVMRFIGSPVPLSVEMVLLSRSDSADGPIHDVLNNELANHSMAAVKVEKFSSLLRNIAADAAHPIHRFTSDKANLQRSAADELKESVPDLLTKEEQPCFAFEGVATASAPDFQQLAVQAVKRYLHRQLKADELTELSHARGESETAVPYHFSITTADGTDVLVSVKGTASQFEEAILVSTAELIKMRDASQRYDIYRVSAVTNRTATLRIAADLRGFATRLLPLFASLPDTIVPTGFSVKPEILPFSREISLAVPEKRQPERSRESEGKKTTEREIPSQNRCQSVSLEDYGKDEVMAAFRSAIRGAHEMTEAGLLRAVTSKLGFQRMGKNVRRDLKGHLRAAIRRRIIERDGEFVTQGTSMFGNYDDEFLLKTLRSVMCVSRNYDRDEVIDAVARHLGFGHTTGVIRETMKSTFNSAIRRGLLGYKGRVVWRIM